jgi:DeoR/GlpR family transcriptional regulator of sugar metabolism
MTRTTQARRLAILEAVREAPLVRVTDLSRRFGVSEVSIRRDLAILEEMGLLRRVHGGAVALPPASLAHSYESKLRRRLDEKQRIGHAAARLIRPGDSVILDSGTTVLQIAREIARSLNSLERVTVITASFPVCSELALVRGIQLFVLGGVYLPEYQTLVGPETIACLRNLHADKLFMGGDGITFEHGITAGNVLEAEVSRAMVGAAKEVVVVADSSKIGAVGFTTIVPLSAVHKLITDVNAPPEFVEKLRASGVEVLLV